MSFFNSLMNLISFNNLSKENKKFVFFSESNFYKFHYIELMNNLETYQKNSVILVTSDKKDFEFYKSKFKSYLIENKLILRVFFKILECKFLITTLPDLGNNFDLSENCEKYVYFFHSVTSVHKVYTHSSFENFDIILTNGDYQKKELEYMEQKYDLKKKLMINNGNFFYDYLKKTIHHEKLENKKILFAPSWNHNEKNLFADYSIKIIDLLLSNNFSVILRPHPEHFKRQKKIIDEIRSKFIENPNFELDQKISNVESMEKSSIVITDNSAIVLEFHLILKRPIIYLNYMDRIHNKNFEEIKIESINEVFKKEFGKIIDIKELDSLPVLCNNLISTKSVDVNKITEFENTYISNVGNSSQKAAEYLIQSSK